MVPRARFEAIKKDFTVHPQNTDGSDAWSPVRNCIGRVQHHYEGLVNPSWRSGGGRVRDSEEGAGVPHPLHTRATRDLSQEHRVWAEWRDGCARNPGY